MRDCAQHMADDGIPTWEVLLSAPAARPIHSMVQGPDGRWCLSDELNHRLIIVHPDGTRHLVGGPGYDAGEFLHPRGLTTLTDPVSGETRLYVCDAGNHRIQILTVDGVPLGAFGGFGTGPGQFNAPSDIAVVRPVFRLDEEEPGADEGEPVLVVADQRNNRLQVFERDGALVTVVGAEGPTDARPLSRAGWPYFRTGVDPYLAEPSRLAWEEGQLEVTCRGGSVVPIDLAAAMLPDFATWQRETEQRMGASDPAGPDDRPQPPAFRVLEGGKARTAASLGRNRKPSPSVEHHLCRI